MSHSQRGSPLQNGITSRPTKKPADWDEFPLAILKRQQPITARTAPAPDALHFSISFSRTSPVSLKAFPVSSYGPDNDKLFTVNVNVLLYSVFTPLRVLTGTSKQKRTLFRFSPQAYCLGTRVYKNKNLPEFCQCKHRDMPGDYFIRYFYYHFMQVSDAL